MKNKSQFLSKQCKTIKTTGYRATKRIQAKLVWLPVDFRAATRLRGQNIKIGSKKYKSQI